MTRRDLLASSIMLPVAACARQGYPPVANADDMIDDFLQPTEYIDTGHPAIVRVVDQVTQKTTDPREKAIALFKIVRALPFGFASGFWDNKASDVLRAGRGYCNTKSTLFVALLRAAGIPARQYFVEIDAAVLFGVLDPGTAMVDHSYVEVRLDGKWVATDAYIVDPPLFAAAQTRLAADNRLLGYGAHAKGSNDWDGRTPSFSQYNILDARPIGSNRWGVYADVGDFYARASNTHNRLNSLLRACIGVVAAPANRRAEALRKTILA